MKVHAFGLEQAKERKNAPLLPMFEVIFLKLSKSSLESIVAGVMWEMRQNTWASYHVASVYSTFLLIIPQLYHEKQIQYPYHVALY